MTSGPTIKAAEETMPKEWGVAADSFARLKILVGEPTYQDLLWDKLERVKKKEDLFVILNRLATRSHAGVENGLPAGTVVLLPMMDVVARVLKIDNYLEGLLSTSAFKQLGDSNWPDSGRDRLERLDAALKCIGIREFTRAIEWITRSANQVIGETDLLQSLRDLESSLAHKDGKHQEKVDEIFNAVKRLRDPKKKKTKEKKLNKRDMLLNSLIDSEDTKTKIVIDFVDQLIGCYRSLPSVRKSILISSLASVVYRDSRYPVLTLHRDENDPAWVKEHGWVGNALEFLRDVYHGEYGQFAELVDLGIAALREKSAVPVALTSDAWLLGKLYDKLSSKKQLSPNDSPYKEILKLAKKKLLKLTLRKDPVGCTVTVVNYSDAIKTTSAKGQVSLFVHPIIYEERRQKHPFIIAIRRQNRTLEDAKQNPLMTGDVIVVNGDRTKEYLFYGIDSVGRIVAVDMTTQPLTLTYLNAKEVTKLRERDARRDPELPLDSLNGRIRERRRTEYTAGQLPTHVAFELQKLTEGKVQGKSVQDYITRTQSLGFRSYIVGGGVRDTLLGRTVNDVDLATLMPAMSVYEALLKEEPLGRKYTPLGKAEEQLPKLTKNMRIGIVKVDPDNPQGIDIVTFHDGMNKPGSKIVSGSGFIYDALSRDFTFNAIYYDSTDRKIIDATGCGLDDLGYCYRTADQNLSLTGADAGKNFLYGVSPIPTEVKLRFVCCAMAQAWEQEPETKAKKKTDPYITTRYKDELWRHLLNFPVDMARWIKFLSKNNKPEILVRYIPFHLEDLAVIERALKHLADKDGKESENDKIRFATRMGCSPEQALAVFDDRENFISITDGNKRVSTDELQKRENLVDTQLLKSLKGSLIKVLNVAEQYK